MLQLKNMFRGIQTLLGKYNKAKKQETKDKYYGRIKEKLDTQNINKLVKEDIQRQKQRKQMEKRLKAAQKQQRKLEKERARQDAKLKKLRKQRDLANRLLSDDERNLLIRRKNTQALDQSELKSTKN